MLIHEDHAHLHWCPDARVMIIDASSSWGIEAAGGNNRIVRITDAATPPAIHFQPIGSSCIGRLCAAWRPWHGAERTGYCGRGGPPTTDTFTEGP